MSRLPINEIILVVAASLMCSGCANRHYEQTEVGEFSGSLDLRWIKPNRFIYEPNPDDPLTFVREDGTPVIPERIATDGGSIPRLLWSVPPYSPWGYAPAYIVHDYIFESRYCGSDDFSFEQSAVVLSEAIKTLMETGCAPVNKLGLYSIHEAVASPIAREHWDNGECKLPLPAELAADAPPGEVLFRISFAPTSAADTRGEPTCGTQQQSE